MTILLSLSRATHRGCLLFLQGSLKSCEVVFASRQLGLPLRTYCSSWSEQKTVCYENGSNLLDLKGEWQSDNKEKFLKDMRIIVDFISEKEEAQLMEEIEPYMKRLRYEFDHWDDAIHGFRETERKHWYPHNRQVLERVRSEGFQEEIMPYIHILDLAEDGVIKPHIDSTRYCGHTIAGLSLLSDSVMRLVHASNKTDSENSEDYRSQPKAVLENNFYADILLPRRSLYIMSHYARYDFTHEILANTQSTYMGQPIKKDRRISIICRNEP